MVEQARREPASNVQHRDGRAEANAIPISAWRGCPSTGTNVCCEPSRIRWGEAMGMACSSGYLATWLDHARFGRSESLALAPLPALASPFCVQTQVIPAQCMYVDAASCKARAKQLGGTCTVNPAEVHVAPGLGHYCLLTSGQVSSCIYAERDRLRTGGKTPAGVCIQAPGRPESPRARSLSRHPPVNGRPLANGTIRP